MIQPEAVGAHISLWGEGPIWHENRLLYVDIEAHKIVAFDPATNTEKLWDVGQRVGTVVPRANRDGIPQLVWAGDQGFYFFDMATGKSTAIVDPEPELKDNRFNDGKCDPAGRFWAGSICLARRPEAALYCLHTDLHLEKKYGPVTNSNGIIWSRDGATMYYIDTPSKKIRAFDFEASSSEISNERVIWDTSTDPTSPDGMTIDTEGRLWIAFCHGSKVICYDPATKKAVEEIKFPCKETTACAFGGEDLRELYVTTGKSDEPLAGR